MARTIASQIGHSECGDCAVCGEVVGLKLTQEDMQIADDFDSWMHPRSVYRDCPHCGTTDASILIS